MEKHIWQWVGRKQATNRQGNMIDSQMTVTWLLRLIDDILTNSEKDLGSSGSIR